MSRSFHVLAVAVLSVVAGARVAAAGKVEGKLELPAAPPRPPPATKGFLERVENPLKNLAPVAVAPYLVVVLESDVKPVENPGDVPWELVGESFGKPVIAAPVGAKITINNQSKTSRVFSAVEDPKLIEKVPVNPTGPMSFRVAAAKVYTVVAQNAPHLRGTLVGVSSKYISGVDANGKFDFGDVSEGAYKLRIFYRDRWLEREEPVNVPAKAKQPVEVVVRGALVPPAKK
jgi:hypothetical protein